MASLSFIAFTLLTNYPWCLQKKRHRQQAKVSGQAEPSRENTDMELEAAQAAEFDPRPEDEGSLKVHRRRLNPAVDLDADEDSLEGYGLAHNAARSELVRGSWGNGWVGSRWDLATSAVDCGDEL